MCWRNVMYFIETCEKFLKKRIMLTQTKGKKLYKMKKCNDLYEQIR